MPTVREKRKVDMREERLQGIAQGRGSTPHLASSSVMFPGRNECLETHCCLSIKEERRQFLPDLPKSLRQKKDGGENRATVGEEEKKSGKLIGVTKTSKELAEWRRLQPKNLNILGLAKRKKWSW